MRRKTPRFTLLLVSLLVLLTTGQGVASGFVLCVGADGHSAFEEAFAGKCAPPTPAAPACPEQQECSCSACADPCGPCQDLAFSADSLQARSRIGDDTPPTAPLFFPPTSHVIPAFIRELTANLSPQPPPSPYTELIALRTVVLLN